MISPDKQNNIFFLAEKPFTLLTMRYVIAPQTNKQSITQAIENGDWYG